jgi:hypothetical protein
MPIRTHTQQHPTRSQRAQIARDDAHADALVAATPEIDAARAASDETQRAIDAGDEQATQAASEREDTAVEVAYAAFALAGGDCGRQGWSADIDAAIYDN